MKKIFFLISFLSSQILLNSDPNLYFQDLWSTRNQNLGHRACNHFSHFASNDLEKNNFKNYIEMHFYPFTENNIYPMDQFVNNVANQLNSKEFTTEPKDEFIKILSPVFLNITKTSQKISLIFALIEYTSAQICMKTNVSSMTQAEIKEINEMEIPTINFATLSSKKDSIKLLNNAFTMIFSFYIPKLLVEKTRIV